jgi:hypothetical protein
MNKLTKCVNEPNNLLLTEEETMPIPNTSTIR